MFPLSPMFFAPGGKTALLLHCDGADGSTTFTDNSQSPHTITRAGNAQIDTAQSVFGGASALFDGTGDWLLLDGSNDFVFGTGEFTIDFRVRFASLGSFQGLYDMRSAGTTPATGLVIYKNSDHTIRVVNGGSELVSTTVVVINTWYHVAVTRQVSTLRLSINGTVEASGADPGNYVIPASRPVLGALDTGSLGNALNGWLDEVRVIRGRPMWSANFTPPAAAYPNG
jgi:hypothetical protein